MQNFVEKGLYDVFKNQSYPKNIVSASLVGYKKDGKVVAVFVNEFPSRKENALMDGVCVASRKEYPFTVGRLHSLISPLLGRDMQDRLFTQGATPDEALLTKGMVLCELTARDVAFAVREWLADDVLLVEVEKKEYERKSQ
jgi:hypothetical protein